MNKSEVNRVIHVFLREPGVGFTVGLLSHVYLFSVNLEWLMDWIGAPRLPSFTLTGIFDAQGGKRKFAAAMSTPQ